MQVSTLVDDRSGRPDDTQANRGDALYSEIPEWLQEFREILEEFRENLVDDEIP